MADPLSDFIRQLAQLSGSVRLHDATAAIQHAMSGGSAWPYSGDGAPSKAVHPSSVAATADQDLRDTEEFTDGSFANDAGERAYKLYIPPGAREPPLPLVVMLHGCQQDPDDFAAGTRLNELARTSRCYVLYPAQPASANGSGCWNWFQQGDQQRDRGEPSIIAGMTSAVMAAHAVDPSRVFIAGLSAGGAMAATMAVNYPDLYAAAGVHSGLPHAAASDMISAMSAMRRGAAAQARAQQPAATRRPVRTIVFHGDQDTTVHPCNGSQVNRPGF